MTRGWYTLSSRNPLDTTKAPRPVVPAHEIARRAYEKWVNRGRRHGDDYRDWFEAEAELRREYRNPPR